MHIKRTMTPLHKHMMIVYSDGEILIFRKQGIIDFDVVAHFSYNMGDDLEENIIRACFFMDCLEQGLSFDEASDELRRNIFERKENKA